MAPLSQRIAMNSWTATLLPLPKGRTAGGATAFCGGEPVGYAVASGRHVPYWWRGGTPVPIEMAEVKKVAVWTASGTQMVGMYDTPKGTRALVWNVNGAGKLSGREIHPAGWERSAARNCCAGEIVGFGRKRDGPSCGLYWPRSGSVVALNAGNESDDAFATGVAPGVQVGHYGHTGRFRACLWRGTPESRVELHPERYVSSEATGAGGDAQIGLVWLDVQICHSALWHGSAASFVDLHPRGFETSHVRGCARGLQCGSASINNRGVTHAILWGGAADACIDLQPFAPPGFDSSVAHALYFDGDRLLVAATVLNIDPNARGDERPVIFEAKLLS